MGTNELIERYEKQAENLEIKLKRITLKENQSKNDHQRIGILQGQLMVIDTVIDDLMLLDTEGANLNFNSLMLNLKNRYKQRA